MKATTAPSDAPAIRRVWPPRMGLSVFTTLVIAALIAVLVALSSRRSATYRQALPLLPGEVRVVLLARSADGLRWTLGPKPVLDGADVPDLLRVPAGGSQARTLLYYMDAVADHLAVLDLGTNTRTPLDLGPICEPSQGAQCVDPAAMSLPGGGVRLFFVAASIFGDPATTGAKTAIMSATSPDGVHFTVAEQPVLAAVGLVDPDPVRLADGRLRLYISQLSPRSAFLRSAISDDDQHFRLEPGMRLDNASASSTTPLPDGSFRHWYHDIDSSIRQTISADGLALQDGGALIFPMDLSPNTRLLGAEAPSVIQTDGGWLMALSSTQEPRWPFNELQARRTLREAHGDGRYP